MISKTKLLGLAGALALLQATAAGAAVIDWSFTAAGGLTGSGTFTADQDPVFSDTYHLTSATGSIGGEAVTLSSYDGADNLAFPGSPFVIDSNGIGFSTASGFYNLYEFFDGLVSPIYDCGGQYCIEGPNAADVSAEKLHQVQSLSITLEGGATAPEPAAWAMMLVGFGGLGAVLRQRRRSAAA